MTDQFSDASYTARLRDFVRKAARKEFNRIFPPDEFGTVTTVDEANNVVWVQMTGATDSISVAYPAGFIPTEGDVVRVTGRAGSRYVAGGVAGSFAGGTAALAEIILDPVVLVTGLVPGEDFTWTPVAIGAKMALVWAMTISSSSELSYQIRITSEPDGDGDLLFLAAGMPALDYRLTWPWIVKNTDDPQTQNIYVGIRNTGVSASDFSITEFKALRLG